MTLMPYVVKQLSVRKHGVICCANGIHVLKGNTPVFVVQMQTSTQTYYYSLLNVLYYLCQKRLTKYLSER